MTKNHLPNYIIPIIILAGTALAIFYLAMDVSTNFGISLKTFDSLSNSLASYISQVEPAWRPRLLSNGLASIAVRISRSISTRVAIPLAGDPIQLAVGLWTMIWYSLTGFLFIGWLKKSSVFYIFGLFAGTVYGYLPIGGSLGASIVKNYIYPWDLPALFIFSLFTLLFVKHKYWWLLALIVIGVGFKETAMILCLVFLLRDFSGSYWNPFQKKFWEQFRKESWLLFALSIALSFVIKIAIGYLIKAPSFFLTMDTIDDGTTSSPLVLVNLNQLLDIFPFLVNAGTLLAFFLLPAKDEKIHTLKLIAGAFILGNLFFGIFNEYRIWFEMIPFALYVLDMNLLQERIG